jgi:hypothetical protein
MSACDRTTASIRSIPRDQRNDAIVFATASGEPRLPAS